MDVLYRDAGPRENSLWQQFVFGRPSTSYEAERLWPGLPSHAYHHNSIPFELRITTVVILAIPHLNWLVSHQMLDCHYPQTKASRGQKLLLQ